jgi:hypothetical protein
MLADELHQKQQLLYGLHAVSADSIGMAPELTADELEAFPLDAARLVAKAWAGNVGTDADIARDPRLSLPVARETDPETGLEYAIYWAVVGVKAIHVQASFPESMRPEIVVTDDYSCQLKGWAPFEPYMLVEQTLQVRRRADRAPLTRDEFRALCDENPTAEAIGEAFANAP